MRWIVVGAGAVGGVVGGLLANAGDEVTLVARGDHREAIAADGLRVRTPSHDVTVRCPVTESIAAIRIGRGDVVLLAVKSQDSEAALRELAACADPGAVIVCLQNGLENERVAARRFADVLSVPVMLPSTIVEPGMVAAWGAPHPAVLDVGRYPDAPVDDLVRSVANGFVAAGMLSTARPDIARWKRRKLLMNVANSVQALVGLNTGQQLVELATAEAEACFAAAGLAVATVEEDIANRDGRMEVVDIPGLQRGGGSSWQSLVRGTGSIEADYLNGEVCLLGRLHGVATPVNALLQRRANAAAAAGLEPGSTTEAELLRAL
jgi:2-dehydropantoate 2-reductase